MSSVPSPSRPPHRQRSQAPGASRAISPALLDSEDEYDRFCVPFPALSFDTQAPPPVLTRPNGTGSRVTGTHKKKRQKNRQLSEKGVGTDASDHPIPEPAFLPAGPPLATSSDDEYWTAYGDLDLDDSMQVEQLLTEDTDREATGTEKAASSSVSFAFPSRSTTMSSIGSSAPSDSPRTPSRKRLRLEVAQAVQEAPNTKQVPSQAQRKMARENAAREVELPSVASSSSIGAVPVLPSFDVDMEASVPRIEPGSTSVIAHNPLVQKLMDETNISWGVQYEIARGVSDGSWKWEDVTPDILRRLQGSNAEAAPQVNEILRRVKGGNVRSPKIWAELDREQEAILENQSRGLGLQGEWRGERDWFGGQVQQVARIIETPDKNYHLRLEKMEMRKSHRFARFLGSRHLMQFKLPDKFENGAAFLLRNFVLCGRIFVPFCVKDGNVYLLETKDDFERRPVPSQGDQYRVSFTDFIQWHNPMQLNGSQSVNKWIARFDLGLSTSIPVLRFAHEDIYYIDDECAEHLELGKVPTEKIYTDGCGFMNGAALMAIARQLAGLGSDRDQRRPTAVQGRIFGSKGVWMLHPEDQSPDSPPRIWIRDSQLKVKLVPHDGTPQRWHPQQLKDLHPAHFIFDLVAPSRASIGSRLSRSVLLNLSHNRVPTSVLAELMKESLETEVKPLLSWTGPHADILLHNAIDRSGRVSLSRIQRTAAGTARALGLTRWQQEKGLDEDDAEGDNATSTSATEEIVTLHEKILCALQAGFSPLESSVLAQDLWYATERVIEKFVKEYHITLPESADAFIVPDPYGVLGEGEIHFRSSKNLRDPLKHQYPDVLTGDVLIYRNPCRLPSDVQKVKAVQHPRLFEYVDVIVLPTKGVQSLASLLAGGDVDGDVAVCIFDQELVGPFQTHQTCKEPPSFAADNFEPLDSILTVAKLFDKITKLAPSEKQSELQQHLLKSFTANFQIGTYSKCHENAAYAYGYNHPDSLRLAFMFNTVLDSRKTGMVVKQDVYKRDMRNFNRDPPKCMADPNRKVMDNSNTLKRRPNPPYVVGRFILDELMDKGAELLAHHKHRFEDIKPTRDVDPDLERPYSELEAFCRPRDGRQPEFPELVQALSSELAKVKAVVEKCCMEGWSNVDWGGNRTPGKAVTAKQQKRVKSDMSRNLQATARVMSQSPPATDVPLLTKFGLLDKVRASYACKYKPRFAFAVAFRTICLIKSEAKGQAPMTNMLNQAISVPSAAVRLFSAQAVEFGTAPMDI